MNIVTPIETRIAFRDWLRAQLRDLEFYNKRGDHYLIREFHKYCVDKGQDIDEASLGRYLRDENPVIPTPERCRMLGAVLQVRTIAVMKQAGLVIDADFEGIGVHRQAGQPTSAKAGLASGRASLLSQARLAADCARREPGWASGGN